MLVVVSGVGTEIGKTHVCEALLRAAPSGARVVGYKPVETGVPLGSPGADAERLRLASTFHVKRPLCAHVYEPPISPHLAARRAGRPIDFQAIAAEAARLAAEADLVIVELAGGLFSPLGDTATNADLALRLGGALLLVAPDRIGVLHDVRATTLAAATRGLRAAGILLTAPAHPDPSSGSNGAELIRQGASLLASLPRGTPLELAALPVLRRLVGEWLSSPAGLAPA